MGRYPHSQNSLGDNIDSRMDSTEPGQAVGSWTAELKLHTTSCANGGPHEEPDTWAVEESQRDAEERRPMSYDLIVKDAKIIDGTGLPAFAGDVGVRGGKIATIGRIDGDAKTTYRADGRVLAPGFIDIHTHLDAQLFWDPIATCSCYHGVTSVVVSNCGLGIAPCKNTDADREFLIRMLSRVEAMPADVLRNGIPWDWTSLPSYFSALERRLGVNVGVMIGHSPLRYYVMGAASTEREATSEEERSMQEVVREAIRAGALGLSTSGNVNHMDQDGRPIPSRKASQSELHALGAVFREEATGVLQTTRGSTQLLVTVEQAARMSMSSGRPVAWSTIVQRWNPPNEWRELLERQEHFMRQGARIYPIVSPRDMSRIFTLKNTQEFDLLPSWKPLMLGPVAKRAESFRDPEIRKKLRWDAVEDPTPTRFSRRWDKVLIKQTKLGENKKWEGTSIAEMAGQQGKELLDCFLDLALEEDLDTEFRILDFNGDDNAVAEILTRPYSLIGLSDAGAHLAFECGQGYCSRFLGYWVREKGIMSLEEGVRRLTTMPAAIYGIQDRGIIKLGYAADMVVFDPATISELPLEFVNDLPDGGVRAVQRACGIHATFVNGEALIVDGEHTGSYPGRLLRNSLSIR